MGILKGYGWPASEDDTHVRALVLICIRRIRQRSIIPAWHKVEHQSHKMKNSSCVFIAVEIANLTKHRMK